MDVVKKGMFAVVVEWLFIMMGFRRVRGSIRWMNVLFSRVRRGVDIVDVYCTRVVLHSYIVPQKRRVILYLKLIRN